MGDGAKNVLEAQQIRVVRGCKGDIRQLVNDFLSGKVCDSGVGCAGHEGGCSHHGCHQTILKLPIGNLLDKNVEMP